MERSERKGRPGAGLPLGGAIVGGASHWEGGDGVLEPSAAKGPVQGALSAASFLPFRSHPTRATQQSNPNCPPGTQYYGLTPTHHAQGPMVSHQRLLKSLPRQSSIPGEKAVPTEIHPDPLTCTQAPPTADQSFQLGASTISPTPPEFSMNQAILDPFLRGVARD